MLFASTCDHYIDVPDRFDGGSGMETIADPTPRGRGRVIPFSGTPFGHDLTTLQALRAPYTDDGGYTGMNIGALLYLDSGGTPSASLDFQVGAGVSAVLLTFTEDQVAISLDGDTPTTHALPLPLDTWCYVSTFCDLIEPAANLILIFVDATPAEILANTYDLAVYPADYGGAATRFTSYEWTGASSYGDDFTVSNVDIVPRVEGYCCKPTSNGLTVEEDPGNGRWECSSGTSMYILVDEMPTPDTGDYIYASGSDYEQYFGTNAGSVVPSLVGGKQTAVYMVNPVALIEGSVTQPDPNAEGFDATEHPEWREVSPALNADGNANNGSNGATMPGTAWRFYDAPMLETPGSNPWTRALAVAAQTGVDANDSSGTPHLIPYENDMLVAQCMMEVYVYAGAAVAQDDDIVCIA